MNGTGHIGLDLSTNVVVYETASREQQGEGHECQGAHRRGRPRGRAVRLVQDVSGHFSFECDGVQAEEAFYRGTKSDALMRAEGYQPVVEVYPAIVSPPVGVSAAAPAEIAAEWKVLFRSAVNLTLPATAMVVTVWLRDTRGGVEHS